MGAWPSNVSADLSHVFHCDVGSIRYFLVDVSEAAWRGCFTNLSEAFDELSEPVGAAITKVEMHHIGVIATVHAAPQVCPEVLYFFVALQERGFLPGECCESVATLKHWLGPLTVAGPVAVPTSSSPQVAAFREPAAPPIPEVRTVREPAAQVTYSRDTRGWCRLCNSTRKQLRHCWECNTWACRNCSFWCTMCPKSYEQYNICGTCDSTGWYLWKLREKVWCCGECWPED